MSVFTTYLQLGFWHIWSWQATDHLTFLLALCAPYALADWRRLVALVTSFTVGHSLTLALATLGLVEINRAVIEALIPGTIIVTALLDMGLAGRPMARPARRPPPVVWTLPNALALGFGLIHGLGFANVLRALGEKTQPVVKLLSFNLGVELGQLLVVSFILLLGFVVLRGFGAARRDWVLVTSGAALGVSVLLLVQLLVG
ncbi:MAG: HupE/UreJ family protein [Hymenobacter sp.]|nr:MAG: HupE/UreJ family protein [Hymenobacter sp.]